MSSCSEASPLRWLHVCHWLENHRPGESLTRAIRARSAEVTDLSGNSIPVWELPQSLGMSSFGEATPVEDPQRRGVGRPSVVIRYTPQLARWLGENPDLSGAEILRRLRLCGYRGGKSALYELVRRLRARQAATVTATEFLGLESGGEASTSVRGDQDPQLSAERRTLAKAS